MSINANSSINDKSTISATSPSSGSTDGSGGTSMVKLSGFIGDSGINDVSDVKHGVGVDGTVKGFDKGALPGDATLTYDDVQYASVANNDVGFIVNGPPLPSALEGASISDTEQVDFRYEPYDGTPTEVTNVGLHGNTSIEYGALTGKVTDVDGNPVEGASIKLSASGIGVQTDSMGNYTLQTDAGSKTVKALKGGFEESVSITKFSSTVRDFQFAGLTFVAQLSDGTAIPSAPVSLNGGVTRRTGENGKVRYTLVPPNSKLPAKMLDQHSLEIATGNQGADTRIVEKFGTGSVAGEVVDGGSGAPVADIDVKLVTTAGDYLAGSSRAGGFAVGAMKGTPSRLVIGEDDKRYTAESVEANPDGTFPVERVELQPEPQVTQR